MKVMAIQIKIGVLGMVHKDLKRRLEELKIGGWAKNIQIENWEDQPEYSETWHDWVGKVIH